jgi:hypothetical protein
MITVVSGLPRSGTSLMMQMLEAGGMEILTDHGRKPDESNPRGYYEFENVKSLARDNSWLGLAENKAVKIVVQLLYFLPSNRQYAVLFMERDMTEILKSQFKMLDQLGASASAGRPEVLARTFQDQVDRAKRWLSLRPEIRTLFVNHREIMDDPISSAKKINAFLGDRLSAVDMPQVVEAALYRQRVG